jgi:hypothetical protein
MRATLKQIEGSPIKKVSKLRAFGTGENPGKFGVMFKIIF